FLIKRDDHAQNKSVDMSTPTAPRLPLVQPILYEGGALGPIDIVVEGHAPGGALLVSRRVRVGFCRGRTVKVKITLERACETVLCGTEQTCKEGHCMSLEESLPELPACARQLGGDGGACAVDAARGADASCEGTPGPSCVLGLDCPGDPCADIH